MSRYCFPYPRSMLLLGLVLSLYSLSMWAVADAPAVTYSFTILDVPGATSTYPASINASGQVAGYYFDGAGRHGFVYSNGAFTTLDVPGATSTYPASINASGQVAGYYFDGTGRHGFVYSNGAFTTLDAPGATNGFYDGIDHGTVPANINASGQVVGYYFDGAGPHGGPHGFVYSGGTFTLLNVPGALATWATSINDNGQVTGSYEDGSSRY